MWLVLKLMLGATVHSVALRPSSSAPAYTAPAPRRRSAAACLAAGDGGLAQEGPSIRVPPLGRENVTSVPPSSGLMLTGCCLECCCRREKGAQGLGSTGQLDTETSLALPESTMGSFMLLQLVSQPYCKLVAKSVGD